MWWFNSKKHPKKIHVPHVQFIAEQDGPPEQKLKNLLIDFFQRDQSVNTAYLAQVVYRDRLAHVVALCIRAQFGEDHGMAEKVGKIFTTMFGRGEFLDIIFINEQQETELRKVCLPFFKK